jgi:hypothetical protein
VSDYRTGYTGGLAAALRVLAEQRDLSEREGRAGGRFSDAFWATLRANVLSEAVALVEALSRKEEA